MVAESGKTEGFENLDIPKSTLRSWVKNGPIDFITLPELKLSSSDLVSENIRLKVELEKEQSKNELIFGTVRIFGFQIQYKRLPTEKSKVEVLELIKKSVSKITLKQSLEIIGLSFARYHSWVKRAVKCSLKDEPSCPKVSPSRLTAKELLTIKGLATDAEYRFFSIASLSLLALRAESVVASASTWSRVIKKLGIDRVQKRIYPQKPKVGIRASKPGQIWHLDQSIIKLEDGERCFIQAVIDNFSRYVLAWHVSREYGGLRTRDLLMVALKKSVELGVNIVPNVFVDGGSENINEEVDKLIEAGLMFRTIAQVDVDFSNSMIEVLFDRMKNRHLYRVPLNSVNKLENETSFYVNESNDNMPHVVLKGATPFEVFTENWGEGDLAEMKKISADAKIARRLVNQSLGCGVCLA